MNALFAVRHGLLALAVLPFIVTVSKAQFALGGAAGGPSVAALNELASHGVLDGAGMFSSGALATARGGVEEIRNEYRRDLFFETIAHVPDADRKQVKSMGRRQAEHYFADWAKTRSKAHNVDGVYVLICKEPRHVQVVVDPSMSEQLFTDENARALRKHFEGQLLKAPDVALEDAVVFVHDALKENLAESHSAALSIPFETVAAIVGVAVGAWLLLSLVRAVMRRRDASGSDPAHVGLLSGFFAALFGTTAGHWVYDHVFHAHAPAAPATEAEYSHTSKLGRSTTTSEAADDDQGVSKS